MVRTTLGLLPNELFSKRFHISNKLLGEFATIKVIIHNITCIKVISSLLRSYQRQEVNTLRKASERLEDEVTKLKKQLANEKFER